MIDPAEVQKRAEPYCRHVLGSLLPEYPSEMNDTGL